MEAWYENKLYMLNNKQEYAVEEVKLEWLLKRKTKPKVKKTKNLEREKLAEMEKELKALAALATIEEKHSSDLEKDSGDENINTLSDVSDDIMEGKGKRDKNRASKKRTRKHDPTRDARRLYNLMKY